MVEDDEVLHVVLINPPTLFDVAVIARTLYVGGGPYTWRITVVGSLGSATARLNYARLASESRVPLSIVLSRVATGDSVVCPSSNHVLVLDYARGLPPWELGSQPKMFIVDYSSGASLALQAIRSCRDIIEIEYTRGLGLELPTYDAIAVIYELLIRAKPTATKEHGTLSPTLTVGEALYLAKRVLESLTTFDNYPLLEPNTFMYALRRVAARYGLLLDDFETTVKLDSVEGAVVEEVVAKAYDKYTLQPMGETRLIFNGSTVHIHVPRIGDMVFTVDLLHGRVCVAESLCVSRRPRREESLEGIQFLLGGTYGEPGHAQ